MPAAPEVLQRPRGYDAKQADVWSSGVMLFAMLCCSYPFERPEDERDPRGHHRVVQRIINGARGAGACCGPPACGHAVLKSHEARHNLPTCHACLHKSMHACTACQALYMAEKQTCMHCCQLHARSAGHWYAAGYVGMLLQWVTLSEPVKQPSTRTQRARWCRRSARTS